MKSPNITGRSRRGRARRWFAGGGRTSPVQTAGNALLARLTTATTLMPLPLRVVPSNVRAVHRGTQSIEAPRIRSLQNSAPARRDRKTSAIHQKIVDQEGRGTLRLHQSIASENPTIADWSSLDSKASERLTGHVPRTSDHHLSFGNSLKHTRVGVASTSTPSSRNAASVATVYSARINTIRPSRTDDLRMAVQRIGPKEPFSRIAAIPNAGMPFEAIPRTSGSQSQWDQEWTHQSPNDRRYAQPERPTGDLERIAPPDNGHPAPSAPAQGIVYLDGQALGHWMTEHLGQLLARPDRGPSGIDPRVMSGWTPLSATF